MAPEQIRGQVADPRTDSTRRVPCSMRWPPAVGQFNATNDAALMNAILRGKPDPPTETNPEISQGLNAIVLKAMDIDPALRYQSAIELQVDLQRLSGRPATAPGSRRGYRKMVARAVLATGVLSWPPCRLVAHSREPSSSPSTVAVPTTSLPGESRLRVELAPTEIINSAADASHWPKLIQGLLASELAGVPEISLLDRGDDERTSRDRRKQGVRQSCGANARSCDRREPRASVQCHRSQHAGSVVQYPYRRSNPRPVAAAIGEVGERSPPSSESGRMALNSHAISTLDSSRPYKPKRSRPSFKGRYMSFVSTWRAATNFQRALEIDPRLRRAPNLAAANVYQEGKGARELDYFGRSSPGKPVRAGDDRFAQRLASRNLGAQARHLEVAQRYAPGNRPC